MNILDLAIFIYILIIFGTNYALWHRYGEEKYLTYRFVMSIIWPFIIGVIIVSIADYLEYKLEKEDKSCR